MYISRFQVSEYKCFLRSEEVQLEPGLNIIIGKNNVGKTALVEALGLIFANQPHKSSKIKRSQKQLAELSPQVNLSIILDKTELSEAIGQLHQPACVPIPALETFTNPATHQEAVLGATRKHIDQELFALNSVTLDVQAFMQHNSLNFRHQQSEVNFTVPALHYPALRYCADGFGFPPSSRHFVICNFDRDGQYETIQYEPAGKDDMDVGLHLARHLKSRFYVFRAERMDIYKYALVHDRQLKPNAVNLPAVLHLLPSNMMRKINEYLRLIFPEIYEVQAKPIGGPQEEIEIFVTEFEAAKDDDMISLGSSGSGISQVLAILYLALCAEEPSVIIIDEPQSFLHPGAARKLIEILKELPQRHQYIVATHSPALIAAAEPATITLIKKNRREPSTLTRIDKENIDQINLCMSEVGASLSDVFGYDKVLWVEGDTERICIPLILRQLTKHRLYGTAIVAAHNTGDLLGKRVDPRRVLGIYKGLCEGKGLLPPVIGFIFDRECRTDAEIEKIWNNFAKEGIEKRLIRFLPWRMYENYLLDPGAIAAVLNHLGKDVKESTIAAKLESALSNSGYKAWRDRGREKPADFDQWLKEKHKDYYDEVSPEVPKDIKTIHGAWVMIDLFDEFKVPYHKVQTGRMLTEWMLEHKPEAFDDIKTMLEDLFSTHSAP